MMVSFLFTFFFTILNNDKVSRLLSFSRTPLKDETKVTCDFRVRHLKIRGTVMIFMIHSELGKLRGNIFTKYIYVIIQVEGGLLRDFKTPKGVKTIRHVCMSRL